jgi:hypothetical protein
MTMASADYPRCENCGRPTTAESLDASSALPAWIGGPFCADCMLAAARLAADNPDGDDLFDPDR